MSIKKSRAIPGREIQDLTDFVNNFTLGKPYVTKNFQELRNLDYSTATVEEVGRALATLIEDLKSRGILPSG